MNRRLLGFESLETRRVLAALGLDIQLLADVNGAPGDALSEPEQVLHGPLEVGQSFWIRVLAWDGRGQNAAGVVSLPLNLQWDADVLQLDRAIDVAQPVPLNDPLLTASFPQVRQVQSTVLNPGNLNIERIEGLRALAVPQIGAGEPIGIGSPAEFSLLQFTALAAAPTTPFQIELAGSMAFDDGQQLQEVFHLVDGQPVFAEFTADDPPLPFVQEQIAIDEPPPTPAPTGLSGFVYLDANFDGQLNRQPDGRPLEVGLPNVEVRLIQQGDAGDLLVQTTLTGPDGGYQFVDLAPGTYRVEEVQPAGFLAGQSSLGTICDATDCLPDDDPRLGVAQDNTIGDIELLAGEQATDYDFGERLKHAQVTKRMFLTSATIRTTACDLTSVRCVTVNGSEADDQVQVEMRTDRILVQVNSELPRSIELDGRPTIVIVCTAAGNDSVDIVAAPLAEAIVATAGFGSLQNVDVEVNAENVAQSTWSRAVVVDRAESLDFVGVDDADRALLLDSANADALDVAPSQTTLSQNAAAARHDADPRRRGSTRRVSPGRQRYPDAGGHVELPVRLLRSVGVGGSRE